MGWLASLFFEAGPFYLMDGGYMDVVRLALIANAGAYFAMRAKDNLQITRHYPMPVDRFTGLRGDHVGKPTTEPSSTRILNNWLCLTYHRTLAACSDNLKSSAIT